MGTQTVNQETDAVQLRAFIRHLLHDLQALETMLTDDMIESHAHCIGAEQELVLVNQSWRPAPLAMEMLAELDDPHYTTELGRFNLEVNLDPLPFSTDCLSQLERDLTQFLTKVCDVASRHDSHVALVGILPTLRLSDLSLTNMTPKPRYMALNETMQRLRGGDYEFELKGVDELNIKHDSVMLEACCTSFQVHYQVSPHEFTQRYNLAQLITAPVLAAAANAPLLFGRQLWDETRIPLFQQSIDTRTANRHLRERAPRVSFGRQWVEQSVMEIFYEDLARFRVLLGSTLEEDSLALLKQGVLPTLPALRIHNSTIYRWNRPCFGVANGTAHLRIENRVLPSGPTVLDEVANAAFFFGLLHGGQDAYADVSRQLPFHEVEANFLAAAQEGLKAQFTWLSGHQVPAQELIDQELLPLAESGLRKAGVLSADIDRYLGIVRERIRSGQTGAQWLVENLSHMHDKHASDAVLSALTAATIHRQWEGKPVHEWTAARIEEGRGGEPGDLRIEECMSTDLLTVHPDEPLELAVKLMSWKRVRHIPVEDEQGQLAGLISWLEVVQYYGRSLAYNQTSSQPDPQVDSQADPVVVSAVMDADPTTVSPDTSIATAIALMQDNKLDSLLVVTDERLVGIVTQYDIFNITARLLQSETQQKSIPQAS